MESILFILSILFIALVLLIPPFWSFVVYVALVLYFPDYLRIIVVGLTFSIHRVVAIAMLMRFLLNDSLKREFRWIALDKAVIFADIVYIVILSIASIDRIGQLKLQCGLIIDSTFIYFATRLVFNDTKRVIVLAKVFLVLLIPLAFLCSFEAYSGGSFYDKLLAHRFRPETWLGANNFGESLRLHGAEMRMGFYRAQGPHSHPIILGLCFVLFLPFVWKVIQYTNWKSKKLLSGAILTLGTFTSLSSGPVVAWVVAIAVLLFEHARKYLKILLVVFIILCIFLEFFSDRPHFYHVLSSRIGFSSKTAYVRSKLLDVALERLPEYWLFGYRGRDPGWGPEVTGRQYTDPCVQYVGLAIRYGLPGLMAYLFVVYQAIIGLLKLRSEDKEPVINDISWGLLGSLVTLLAGFLSITAWGALRPLQSILLGVIGSVFFITARYR